MRIAERRQFAASARPGTVHDRCGRLQSSALRMTLRPLAVLFAAAVPLAAQSFNYPDFSSTASLTLLGNAAQSGTAVRLTANSSNQTGWFWRQGAVPVIAGFDTTFSFRITPPTVGTKAEGMALVIHDDPNGTATQGGTVWGMGYGTGANGAVGIRNSIAIEFDTFMDTSPISDSSANELTIHTRGSQGNHEYEQYSIARTTPATNLANGAVHTLRVRYVPGTIEVFVDGSATPAISRAYDFVTGGLYANGTAAPGTNMLNGTAIVGFCATTGAGTLTELAEITSWSWTSTPLTDPCYAGTIPQDLLTVENSTGGLTRTVPLATWQPFTVSLQSPSTFGPGAPYVMLMSLAPSPGAIGTDLGFGPMCIPLILGPLDFVWADTFGLFVPLFPAGPAPFSFPIPAGIITFPFEFTLQAVVATSLSPFSLGITNAVDVVFAPAPAPLIATATPLSAAVGASITLTGQRFVTGATVTVAGTPVVPTSLSPTQIVFPYPAGVPCGSQVTVTNPDGQFATLPFNPTPTITNAVFPSGPAAGNATFILVGSGYATGTTVTIGGAAAMVQSLTAATITVKTPPGTPGQAAVVVTTPGGCSANTTYTYQ